MLVTDRLGTKVYIVDLEGKNRKEVTSGKHGATHTPIFSNDGTMVAWTELAEDGYESDRAVIVVYDLKTNESYKLAPHWDRSPASLSVRSRFLVLFTMRTHPFL